MGMQLPSTGAGIFVNLCKLHAVCEDTMQPGLLLQPAHVSYNDAAF